MSKERMSLREFRDYFITNAERFKQGRASRSDCIEAGWYDWFCKDTSLPRKTYTLGKKVLQLMESPLIDIDKMYVFFKNNCPLCGQLYDSFSICRLDDSGEVKYFVAPKLGYNNPKMYGKANVAYEGNWEGELFDNWKGVKAFFKV